MAKYIRKSAILEARENVASKLIVISARKGEQFAAVGDFLVTDEVALAAIRAQEERENLPANSLPNKGTVYVVPRTEFLTDYELAEEVAASDEAPAATPPGAPTEPLQPAELLVTAAPESVTPSTDPSLSPALTLEPSQPADPPADVTPEGLPEPLQPADSPVAAALEFADSTQPQQ
jgi:hypothetical protein